MDDRALGGITSQLHSVQDVSGDGFGFTWPAKFPMVRIDYVLVRGVQPESSWLLPATGSGHRPVAAGIELVNRQHRDLALSDRASGEARPPPRATARRGSDRKHQTVPCEPSMPRASVTAPPGKTVGRARRRTTSPHRRTGAAAAPGVCRLPGAPPSTTEVLSALDIVTPQGTSATPLRGDCHVAHRRRKASGRYRRGGRGNHAGEGTGRSRCALMKRLVRGLEGRPRPQHIGIMLDGNRRWARMSGIDDPRERLPGRRGEGAGLPALVRLRADRARHPVHALRRQPPPARRPAEPAHRHHRRGRGTARRTGQPLARRSGRRPGPAARRVRHPPQDRHRRHPGPQRAAPRSMSPSATEADERSSTPSRSAPHRAQLPGRGHRRVHRDLHHGAHLQAPVPPRHGPSPTSSSAPPANSASPDSCSGSPPTPKSTSARPTGRTSARSTSCAPCVPTPCANAATAAERRCEGFDGFT